MAQTQARELGLGLERLVKRRRVSLEFVPVAVQDALVSSALDAFVARPAVEAPKELDRGSKGHASCQGPSGLECRARPSGLECKARQVHKGQDLAHKGSGWPRVRVIRDLVELLLSFTGYFTDARMMTNLAFVLGPEVWWGVASRFQELAPEPPAWVSAFNFLDGVERSWKLSRMACDKCGDMVIWAVTRVTSIYSGYTGEPVFYTRLCPVENWRVKPGHHGPDVFPIFCTGCIGPLEEDELASAVRYYGDGFDHDNMGL